MTLKEFNDLYLGKAVHCETEELANEFLGLADSFGYKWNIGDKLTSYNEWRIYGKDTYYRLFPDEKEVIFGNVDNEILKIIQFKGDKNKMTLKDLKQGMVCKLKNGSVITILDGGRKFHYHHDYEDIANLIDCYNEDLTHNLRSFYDIIEITYGDKVVFERKNASRWFVPEVGEEYFFVDNSGDIRIYDNSKATLNYEIFNNNRVFKTRKEAEKRLKQQQATLSVERWIAENDVEVDLHDVDVEKYVFMYDIDTKRFVVCFYSFFVVMPKQFILSSEEKAKQLIKEREKELKIMFGVEE